MIRTDEDLRTTLQAAADDGASERLTDLIRQLAALSEPDEEMLGDLRPAHGGRPGPTRRRAWVALVAASVLALAVVTAVAVRGSNHGSPAAHRSSNTTPSTPSPAATATGPAEVLGNVITTSIPYEGGPLALWLGRDDQGALRLAGGHITGARPKELFASEGSIYQSPDGSLRCGAPYDLQAGFHCGYDAAELGPDHHSWLIVGYVVGDVSTVSLTIDGHARAAVTTPWSANPRVHIYFSVGPVLKHYRTKGQGSAYVDAMIARNAAGKIVAQTSGAIARG